jgi:hypothetical protein
MGTWAYRLGDIPDHIPVVGITPINTENTEPGTTAPDGTANPSPQLGFRFAIPPGGLPKVILPRKKGNAQSDESSSSSRIVYPRPPLMSRDWSADYETSPCWGGLWYDCHDNINEEWPEGISIYSEKIYVDGKLAIPEDLVEELIKSHHQASNHPGTSRLVSDMSHSQRRSLIPPFPPCVSQFFSNSKNSFKSELPAPFCGGPKTNLIFPFFSRSRLPSLNFFFISSLPAGKKKILILDSQQHI